MFPDAIKSSHPPKLKILWYGDFTANVTSFKTMKLAELLHLCSISSRSGVITFTAKNRTGEIHLHDGNLWFASFLGVEGEDAAYALLANNEGNAEFKEGVGNSRPKNLSLSCESLLLEAARRSDENIASLDPAAIQSNTPPESPSPPLASLILLPETTRWNYPIKTPSVSIGRAPENDVCIENEMISSHHCHLQVKNTDIILSDLESLNGTFVNGKKINMVILNQHDLIQIGDATFRLEIKN